jgi:hypothetical protein
VLAIAMLILVPVATDIPAIVVLAVANVLIWVLVVIETRRYGERRARLRRPEAAA